MREDVVCVVGEVVACAKESDGLVVSDDERVGVWSERGERECDAGVVGVVECAEPGA